MLRKSVLSLGAWPPFQSPSLPARPPPQPLPAARRGRPAGARSRSSGRDARRLAAEVATQRAVLDQDCVVCHNQKLKTANLLLDQLDLAQLGGSPGHRREGRAETAGRHDAALRACRGRMPPTLRGADRLDGERSSTRSATPHLPPPGIHRLNRVRIRECDPRPARARSGRHEVPAVGRFDARVRQHRRRAADVAGADGGVPVGGRQDQSAGDWHRHGADAGRLRRARRTSARTTTSRGCRSAPAAACSSSTSSRPTRTTSSRCSRSTRATWAAAVPSARSPGEQLEVTVDGELVHWFDWDGELSRGTAVHAGANSEWISVKAGLHTVGVTFAATNYAPGNDLNAKFLRSTIQTGSLPGHDVLSARRTRPDRGSVRRRGRRRHAEPPQDFRLPADQRQGRRVVRPSDRDESGQARLPASAERRRTSAR